MIYFSEDQKHNDNRRPDSHSVLLSVHCPHVTQSPVAKQCCKVHNRKPSVEYNKHLVFTFSWTFSLVLKSADCLLRHLGDMALFHRSLILKYASSVKFSQQQQRHKRKQTQTLEEPLLISVCHSANTPLIKTSHMTETGGG